MARPPGSREARPEDKLHVRATHGRLLDQCKISMGGPHKAGHDDSFQLAAAAFGFVLLARRTGFFGSTRPSVISFSCASVRCRMRWPYSSLPWRRSDSGALPPRIVKRT